MSKAQLRDIVNEKFGVDNFIVSSNLEGYYKEIEVRINPLIFKVGPTQTTDEAILKMILKLMIKRVIELRKLINHA